MPRERVVKESNGRIPNEFGHLFARISQKVLNLLAQTLECLRPMRSEGCGAPLARILLCLILRGYEIETHDASETDCQKDALAQEGIRSCDRLGADGLHEYF